MAWRKAGKKRRFRQIPCNTYDIPALEQWLEQQAKDGWKFIAWPNEFEASEPENCRYSIQPTPKKEDGVWSAEPSLERRELYGGFGWEFVCTTAYNAFQIWRSTRPDPVPMNTDPETDSYAYDHLWKELRMRNGIFFAVTAMPGLCILYRFLETGHVLADVIAGEGTPFLFLCCGLALLVFACGHMRGICTMRRIIRSLRNGEKLRPRSRRKTTYRKPVSLGAVICLLAVLMLFAPHRQTWLDQEEELQRVYLSSQELKGEAEYGPYMLQRESLVGTKWMLLAEGPWDLAGKFPYQRMVYVNQIEIYAPKPSFVSEILFREIANGYVKEEMGGKANAFTQTEFEDARYHCASDGVQHLVVKEDGKVLYFRSDAQEDLREYLPRIREIMEWGAAE